MRRTLLAALAALAPACTTVRFDGQELELTYVEQEGEPDALELFVRYRGLHAPAGLFSENDGGQLREALAWVRRLERKERVFLLLAWPLEFDLEQGADGSESEVEALLRASVHVTEASLYLDGTGRLCADQRLRWTDVQGSLKVLNRSWNQQLAAELDPEGLAEELDAASRELLARHLAEERDWLQLDARRLRLTIPLSLDSLTASLGDEQGPRPPNERLEELRREAFADGAEVDAGGVHLTWRFDDGGVLRLIDPLDEEPGSFALRDRLQASGSKLETRDLEDR